MNPHIFREYDIRGVYGEDIDADVFEAIGRAFGTMAVGRGAETVAVGRDCRVSSPALAEGLMRGLAGTGLRVIDVGMLPTPVLYFSAFDRPADAAIQVTGSHNPPDYNGMKMMLFGEAVYGEQIQSLRERIEAGAFAEGHGARQEAHDPIGAYIDWVAEHARMGHRRIKVVVDGGNGAGGPTAVAVLERLGMDVVPLYCEPDGTFPNHHPDPTVPEALVSLQETVVAEGADFGVGLDGDADRLGVIDEAGRILWGDKLMIVLARDLLEQEPGATIVAEVKCSQTLFDDVDAHGGRSIMWKVGHSLIKAKMKEIGALLAGEMSGHVFYKHRFFGFDDAIYTATRLAEIVSRSDRPLSEFLEGVPETYATPEVRVDAGNDAVKFAAAAAVADSYRERPPEGMRDIITIDGIRVVFEDGWGLVRASNTQPVLVMRAEATTPQRRDALEADLRARIERAIDEASDS